MILCHSHATSLYLNTCYAIYNLQCRIELKSNSLWKRGKIFHERLKNEKNSFIVEKPFYLHLTCSRQGKPVILSCLGIWKNISVKNFERSWASLRIKILIERGCSLLRYFDCSIGSYIDFNQVSIDALSDSSGCVFRAAEYNVHTNPNSHSLANKFLNGACLLYINKTELCYDSHSAASRENCEKKKLQSVFVVFTLKQVAQCRTRPTIQITVDSR